MNSIEMINRLPPSSAGHPRSATPGARPSDFAVPTAAERFDEILPLLDVVPEAGPPVLFVLGPWLFVVLMLIGPFVLLVTLVLASAVFIAIAAALCGLPYLLVHQLRKPRPHHYAWHPMHLFQHSPTDVTSNGM